MASSHGPAVTAAQDAVQATFSAVSPISMGFTALTPLPPMLTSTSQLRHDALHGDAYSFEAAAAQSPPPRHAPPPLPQLADRVGLLLTGPALPVVASEYAAGHAWTDEMLASLSDRDGAHTLKRNVHTEFSEAKLRHDKIMGAGKASGKASGKATTTTAASKGAPSKK